MYFRILGELVYLLIQDRLVFYSYFDISQDISYKIF